MLPQGFSLSADVTSASGVTVSALRMQFIASGDQDISLFWQKGQRRLQP